MSHPGHRRSGAIDVTHALPFTALPRPALADLEGFVVEEGRRGVMR
jgi:hypothetical protein